MNSELFDIIIPSIAFFIVFFLIFMLLELAMSYSMNLFVFRHWNRLNAMVMRYKVSRIKWIRPTSMIFLVFFTAALLQFTRFFELLNYAEPEIKVFAVEALLGIFLIYFLSRDLLPQFPFVLQLHKYLFVYFSVIVYLLSFVAITVNYNKYQEYINAAIIGPVKENGTEYLENKKRKRLLKDFRYKIYSHECPRIDFTQGSSSSNFQFVYVTTHRDLEIDDRPIIPGSQKDHLTGRLCTNGTESFLLTDHGQWYWVFEESENL